MQAYLDLLHSKEDFFTRSEHQPLYTVDDLWHPDFANDNNPLYAQPTPTDYYQLAARSLEFIEQDYSLLKSLHEDETLPANVREIIKSHLVFDTLLLAHHARYYQGIKKSQQYTETLNTLVPQAQAQALHNNILPLAAARDTCLFFNLYRLFCVFSRLTWVCLIALAEQCGLVDGQDRIAGTSIQLHLDAFKMLAAICNAASVGFYMFTFCTNASISLKHILAGTEEERSVGWYDQVCFELWKRHWRLVNDGVWCFINLLTNFAPYFHLAQPLADKITTCFLILDLVWLYWGYLTSVAVLQRQRDIYAAYPDNYALKQILLDEVDHLLRKKDYEYTLYAIAACLYMCGFTMVLLWPSLVIMSIAFAMCTLAMAMYSKESTKRFIIMLDTWAQAPGEHAAEENQAAMNNFAWALFVNTMMPFLIVGSYALSFPLGMILTIGSFAYTLDALPDLSLGNDDPVAAAAPGMAPA